MKQIKTKKLKHHIENQKIQYQQFLYLSIDIDMATDCPIGFRSHILTVGSHSTAKALSQLIKCLGYLLDIFKWAYGLGLLAGIGIDHRIRRLNLST